MSVNRSAWWQGAGPSMIEPLSLMSGCQSDDEEEEAIQQTLLLNQGWLGCRYADCNAIYQVYCGSALRSAMMEEVGPAEGVHGGPLSTRAEPS